MNTRIISWLLLFLGEAILITAFIILRGSTPDDILVLNIVVSSAIYGLLFIDIIVPWVKNDDKSNSRFGSLGMRWFTTWLYAIAAVAGMISFNLVYAFPFSTQFVFHSILLFLTLLGLFGSMIASTKVKDVYEMETTNRNGLDKMKGSIRALNDNMNGINGLPEDFIRQINMLEEKVRFLSPINMQEAHELENSFAAIAREIGFAISNFPANQTQIETDLKKLERIYQNRKNMYSN